MKKILFCLPLLLLALQSCEIEDEYMYDKGLYTIDWDAAADSSSVTLIDRFWNTEENYFNYGNDGSIKDFHYWPQAHAMDVMIDAYNRTGDSKYSDLFDKWYVGINVPSGRIQDDGDLRIKTALRTIIGKYGMETRLTALQSVILCDIEEKDREVVRARGDAALVPECLGDLE